MSSWLSALVVLAAVIASGVLLVQLAVSESRRSRRRTEKLDRDRSSPQTVPVAPVAETVPMRVVQPERLVRPVYTPPSELPPLPERSVPPPPAPRGRPAPVAPIAQIAPVAPIAPMTQIAPIAPAPAPVQQVSWTPVQQVPWAPAAIMSADGAWLWTGSAWVPSWWGGPTVPPPPAYAVAARPRPVRSSGCGTALGMGCAVVLVVSALITLALLAVADSLFRVSGG
jgi:hypothetical protein